MPKCTVCGKTLSTKNGTICITCFNKNRTGVKNPSWRGSKVKYDSLHKWMRKQIPRPQFCEVCKVGFPIDLANISQKYKRKLSDWEWLCRKCHMKQDGRNGTGWTTKGKSKHPLLKKMSAQNRKYYLKRVSKRERSVDEQAL